MKKFLLPLFALLLLTACEKERAGPVGAEADTAIDFRGLKAESFGGNVDPGSTAAYTALIDGGYLVSWLGACRRSADEARARKYCSGQGVEEGT